MLCFLAMLCSISLGRTQGTIGFVTFTTRISPVLDAPVTYLGQPPGPDFAAALYRITSEGMTLIPGSVTRFRDPSGTTPVVGNYVEPVLVGIPESSPGDPLTVRMAAWRASFGSFESAPFLERAISQELLIPSLGTEQSPATLPSSFTGFIFPIPEPNVAAIVFLGVALLRLHQRCRQR